MPRVASGLVALLVAFGAGGCGSSTGASVPALVAGLNRVDAAAVSEDPERLESAVAGLLRAVDEAEMAGELTAEEADRIHTAAEALLDAAAPTSRVSPSPSEEASTTPTHPPPDQDDEDDEEDEGDDEDEGDRGGGAPGESKGKAKGHQKDD